MKDYKKRIIGGLLVFGCLIVLLKVASNYFSIPFYTYPNFGIKIPPGYKRIGIDISHHQDKINWKQVSEMRDLGKKVDFVFMKATQGNYLSDKQFKRNWSEAEEYKIKRGAYLFFDPRRDGRSQAQYFINRVKLKKGDFAPVIDFEDLYGVSKKVARHEFKACAYTLKSHYGIQPILYTYSDFYRQNLNESFQKFPLWIAHYKSWGKPRIDHDYYFWQFSDRGRMNGIKGHVDFNVSNMGDSKLNKLRIDMD